MRSYNTSRRVSSFSSRTRQVFLPNVDEELDTDGDETAVALQHVATLRRGLLRLKGPPRATRIEKEMGMPLHAHIRSSLHLYKYLLRECERLPEKHRLYYKNHVRQGFQQHIDEDDPERIQQIIIKAVEDAKWVVKKWSVFSAALMEDRQASANTSLLNGVKVWLEKPHVVNARVVGSVVLGRALLTRKEGLSLIAVVEEKTLVVPDPQTVRELEQWRVQDWMNGPLPELLEETVAVLRELVPKGTHQGKLYEVVILEPPFLEVSFVPLQEKREGPVISPRVPYAFHLGTDGAISLTFPFPLCPVSQKWLQEKLLPKLQKWTQEEVTSRPTSLALVDLRKYVQVYERIKTKYASFYVQNWAEHTDPGKHVHEDVGIAAYLISLWKKDGADCTPSFVDLGCGNGLLTHVLTCEGFPGKGVDIRARKSWQLFPSTHLIESAIMPDSTYSEDWLIGNHSDELTPWIPVLAAHSSPTTRFFLMPCCPYAFSGKFQRRHSRKSIYADYLDFLMELCQVWLISKVESQSACILKVCGFDVKQDRLRIPSTKRLALVGIPRPTTAAEQIQRLQRISQFVEGCSHSPKGFHVREPSPVRNCTKIPQNISERILKEVLLQILKHSSVEGDWNTGGQIQLPDLVEGLSSDTLRELKLQHGGLQTLLKNNSHIFICKKGLVSLHQPTPVDRESLDRSSKAYQKWKTRGCFLARFHPNGCPLATESC
ncbi:unnamed protein product, partial [Darwinula stevensoni]